MHIPKISFHLIIICTSVLLNVFMLFHSSSVRTVIADEAEETVKNIVATQIRSQGYACEAPKSAKKDESLSKPDEPVWVLECQNSTYRVRMIADQAAKVERMN